MAGAESLEGRRVLIVEDEYLIADDLARALRGSGGLPVGPVGTIAEAEELLCDGVVDAAILDVNLRGDMATDFIARVAAMKVPCLIVSGYAEEELPEKLKGIPRLEKPVSPESVIETLAKEFERKH